MIYFSFSLRNPWSKGSFGSKYTNGGHIGGHKYWEIEVLEVGGTLLEVEFNISSHRDHGGVDASFGLAGYVLTLRLYDSRHWDDKTNDWQKYA